MTLGGGGSGPRGVGQSSPEAGLCSIPPLFPPTPLREKNGAFVSSPACAFALNFGEQAAPAAQPAHQPCADPSGGPTLPPAANLRAVPTSPAPAEEGDVSSSVTNQDEAQSCKCDDQELSAAFSSGR